MVGTELFRSGTWPYRTGITDMAGTELKLKGNTVSLTFRDKFRILIRIRLNKKSSCGGGCVHASLDRDFYARTMPLSACSITILMNMPTLTACQEATDAT